MNTTIEVMKQAREALKEHAYRGGMIWCADCEEAITALTAEIERLEKVEPVAWMQTEGGATRLTTTYGGNAGVWQPLYLHPHHRSAPFDANFPFGPEVFIEDKPAHEIKKGVVMKLDIVKLAKEAGLWVFITDQEPKLQHFTNLIIEECAKTCLRGDNEYSNGIECAKRLREMKHE